MKDKKVKGDKVGHLMSKEVPINLLTIREGEVLIKVSIQVYSIKIILLVKLKILWI